MDQARGSLQRNAHATSAEGRQPAEDRDVLHRRLIHVADSPAAKHGLTHLDSDNRPSMVDVGGKEVTRRVAVAEARVKLPPNVAEALRESGHRTKKGPVFDTAIIAGVMAAKRTHELIPFCHPLGIDNCAVEIEDKRGGEIVIRCEVSIHHRTGVEMEALTGASVAALTIYDM